MSLGEYLTILRRSWRLVLGVVLASLVAVGAFSFSRTPIYQTTAQVFVSAQADSTSDLVQGSSFAQRRISTYADIISTPAVLEPVVDHLELALSPGDLASMVQVSIPPETVLLDISVSNADPEWASVLANAIGEQFSVTVADLERVNADGPSPVKASVVKPAEVPTSPVSPRPSRDLLLAGVFGILLGCGLALVRDLIDTRVATEQDAARVSDLPVVGAIGYDRDAGRHPLIVQADPHSARAEAFRTLRTNLQFVNAAERPRTIVLTSSVPGEGKTTTTANLALTLAASGSSVVVVEGDLRRPRLLEYMGMEGSIGLTNVLIGETEVEDVLQPFGDSLTVLGAGTIPPNPSELLGSRAMAVLLSYLEERFDYVIIDAPPLLPVTDAAVLAKLADGAILVVGSKIIKREQLHRALQNLENVDAHVLGLVLNRLPTTGPDAYTYYSDGYRPDTSDAPTRKSRKAAEGERRPGLLSRG